MGFKRVPSKKKGSRFERETADMEMPGSGSFTPADVAGAMRHDRRGGKGPQKNKRGKGAY